MVVVQSVACVSSSSTSSTSTPRQLVDFSNTEMAYSSKSVPAILRALAIYQLCGVDVFVRNSEKLYTLATKVLGERVVDWLVRPTFFAHFCAGEDERSIRPTIDLLQKFGVGGILDYAAEADVEEEEEEEHKAAGASSVESAAAGAAAAHHPPTKRDNSTGVFQARVYHYSTEVACDANAEIFHQAIKSVHNVRLLL